MDSNDEPLASNRVLTSEMPTDDVRKPCGGIVMTSTNSWGLEDDYVAAIGKVTIAFSYLEGNLCYAVWAILGGDRKVAECITAEMSFRNLVNLIVSLFKEKETAGVLNVELAPMLENALKLANAAEQQRNTVTHSRWGFTVNLEPVRHKTTAKQKHGLKCAVQAATVSEIESVVAAIEKADKAVLDFVAKFMAYYPPL